MGGIGATNPAPGAPWGGAGQGVQPGGSGYPLGAGKDNSGSGGGGGCQGVNGFAGGSGIIIVSYL